MAIVSDTLASAIDLPEGEIHLWLAYYDEIVDERLHAAYRNVMTDAERSQEPRFHFARDRCRYLVTRALVRCVLSRYAPLAPAAWRFATNAYGRPHIANAEAEELQISFNISHTHSLIALAVARRRALGVDVENVRAREAAIDIADRFFAPAEVAALSAVPRQDQQFRFFEYWTLKESYIKARGMGLSLPLDKFSFHFTGGGGVRLDIHCELQDEPARWEFCQLQPRPEYLIALCAERVQAISSLRVRQVVPMVSATIIADSSYPAARIVDLQQFRMGQSRAMELE